MLITVIAIIHIIVAILLVITVLIQDTKGGGAFGMGGTGSTQILSSTNAGNFLVKLTRILGGIFAITCISLTYASTQGSKSITDQIALPAAQAPLNTEPPATPVDAKTAAGAAAPVDTKTAAGTAAPKEAPKADSTKSEKK
jgi:preprotein translocase subunit SecG